MVVQEDGGEGGSIDLELLFVGNLCCQQGIEAVDALHDEHVVLVQMQLLPALLAHSCLEVILRQFHLLAPEEGIELLVDERDVQCMDALVVEFSVLVLRCVLTMYEVVVQRNLHGLHTAGKELYGEPLAEGRLAAGGRSGDEHDFCLFPAGNRVGDLRYLLFLQCLADVDEVGGKPLLHGFVEVAYGLDAEDALPAVMLLEHLEHLVLAYQFAQPGGILCGRDAQEDTVEVRFQAEEVDLCGIREHRTVVIVLVVVEHVIDRIERAAAAQQLCFLPVAETVEHFDGFFRRGLKTLYGQAGIDDFLHTGADAAHVVGRNGVSEFQIAVVAVRDRDVDHHAAARIEVVYGLAQHEKQRTGVSADARGRVQVEVFHVLVVVDTVVQSLHLVVHFGTHGTESHLEIIFLVNVRKCTSDWDFQTFFVIFAADLQYLFHHHD